LDVTCLQFGQQTSSPGTGVYMSTGEVIEVLDRFTFLYSSSVRVFPFLIKSFLAVASPWIQGFLPTRGNLPLTILHSKNNRIAKRVIDAKYWINSCCLKATPFLQKDMLTLHKRSESILRVWNTISNLKIEVYSVGMDENNAVPLSVPRSNELYGAVQYGCLHCKLVLHKKEPS